MVRRVDVGVLVEVDDDGGAVGPAASPTDEGRERIVGAGADDRGDPLDTFEFEESRPRPRLLAPTSNARLVPGAPVRLTESDVASSDGNRVTGTVARVAIEATSSTKATITTVQR